MATTHACPIFEDIQDQVSTPFLTIPIMLQSIMRMFYNPLDSLDEEHCVSVSPLVKVFTLDDHCGSSMNDNPDRLPEQTDMDTCELSYRGYVQSVLEPVSSLFGDSGLVVRTAEAAVLPYGVEDALLTGQDNRRASSPHSPIHRGLRLVSPSFGHTIHATVQSRAFSPVVPIGNPHDVTTDPQGVCVFNDYDAVRPI